MIYYEIVSGKGVARLPRTTIASQFMAARGTDVTIVGAGILGLAHAWLLARRGHSVTVYERNPKAAGASVRNFGMIWPIGQPAGRMHDLALRSRELWIEVLEASRLPYFATGSLHLVYRG